MNASTTATLVKREPLTQGGSVRQCLHLELRTDSPLPYKVGDSISIAPRNDPERVQQLLERLGHTGEEPITHPRRGEPMTWRHFLLWEANLNKSTAALWRAAGRGDCTREQLEQTVVDGLLSGTPQELAGLLGPLLPRFYSIASSPVCHPHEIHLTLAITELSLGGVNYPGVCSHYLAEQLQLGDQFEVTLKSVDHFTLPNDPNVPIIMVGPGTGIAPYRGFMQERHATDAPGANWLFFGERQRASDFFYQDFWTQLEQQNRLRLDLAFSRDQAHKIYVQHRMLERGEELWQWLQQGAILYVCGDAKRMAPEVEATLHQIAQHHGKMDAQAAFGYLKTLRREKRYLRDVY